MLSSLIGCPIVPPNEIIFSFSQANPDICLSQPLDYSYEPASSMFTITSRLHKQQRSFRAAAFRSTRRPPTVQQAVMGRATPPPPTLTVQPPPSPFRRVTPCSSPFTVDDERVSLSAPDNEACRAESPLGFQRNKLRSFSMRPKRGDSSRRDKAQPAHKSFRGLTTRIKKEVPTETADSVADDKIDLPDERLMRDHVTSSPRAPTFVRQKPERYSKRRLLKKPAAEAGVVPPSQDLVYNNSNTAALTVIPPSPAKYAERSVDVTITPTSPTKSLSGISMVSSSTTMSRAFKSSQDNLDTISLTSQVSSRSQSRLLDDTRSEHSDRLKPVKTTEGASLRPLSKRCGSAYKTSTSDFADRKALFKPNMLKKHKGAGGTLSDSREATPTPELHINLPIPLTQDLLKPPALLPMTKYDSLVESVTTDLPSSPDHMSPVSSPPDTPLTRSPVKCKRESGYMSSSFEVLEDDILSEKVSLADEPDHMSHADMNLMLAAMDVR